MENFLAFKYTTSFSRELDGTGVKFGGEIGFEIIERANARRIAEDFTPDLNMIGWSIAKAKKYPGRNYVRLVGRALGDSLYQTRKVRSRLKRNADYSSSSSSSQSTY
jgi:hypothetical protein